MLRHRRLSQLHQGIQIRALLQCEVVEVGNLGAVNLSIVLIYLSAVGESFVSVDLPLRCIVTGRLTV